MSYRELKSQHGKFHPVQVADFQPDKSVCQKRPFTKNKYGGLNDQSTYEEYAWEFLRRNKFYQSLIDAGTGGKAPHYPLPSWGYRQSDASEQNSAWEYHCGLWSEPYKHYSEAYSDDLAWYPIEYLRQNMRGALGRATKLEDASTQLHITIDLGQKFGPNVSGLKKQLEIAEQIVTAYHQYLKGGAWLKGELDIYPLKKGLLRRYLYVADLYTQLESKKKDPDVAWAKYIAKNIQEGESTFSETDVSKCAKSAFEYIYQWHCLGLLTLTDKNITEAIDRTEPELSSSDGGVSLQSVWRK
jgi:hypothetical protein